MKALSLKLGIVLFASSLGWTPANAETCTQRKQLCLSSPTCTTEYCQKVWCHSTWERCMKTGFWSGPRISRPVDKR